MSEKMESFFKKARQVAERTACELAYIPTPTPTPPDLEKKSCPKCGSYLQRRTDGSIGCQPCDVRELTARPRPVCGTPTPPDLGKEITIQGPCTFCGHPNHWRPDCPLIAAGLKLSQLRAENERLKKERDEAISAYNVRNDEVTGLIGMLEEARAALSGSAEKGGG